VHACLTVDAERERARRGRLRTHVGVALNKAVKSRAAFFAGLALVVVAVAEVCAADAAVALEADVDPGGNRSFGRLSSSSSPNAE
jgi:hypothetical protein